MIVASLLLILVAVVLLVLGLAGGSSLMLITSIAASLLAAVALVVGARQAAATRAATDRGGRRDPGSTGPVRAAGPGTAYGPPRAEPQIPVQHSPSTVNTGGTGWRQPPEPPVTGPGPFTDSAGADPFDAVSGAGPVGRFTDEPAAQDVGPAEAALVARLATEVRVVDRRPRYHLADCPHLVGREHEPLPVSEAVQLGFTPCARCAPDTTLLTDARPR